MKLRHILMAAGLGLSAWLVLFNDKQSTSALVEAETRAEKPSSTAALNPARHVKPQRPGATEKTVDALQDRDTLIGGARSGSGAARLFGNQSWTPPAPPPPAPPPPPPPSAPAVPYKFLGKKLEDGVWEVYLARDDQTFVARERTIVEDAYRVDSIRPPIMKITYLPLEQSQTLSIGGIE
ncbi:MAG TPA: hypothetical protein VN089_19365 [Duganella sp.]|nr:hypothetical protein [Duganella sp.]